MIVGRRFQRESVGLGALGKLMSTVHQRVCDSLRASFGSNEQVIEDPLPGQVRRRKYRVEMHKPDNGVFDPCEEQN